MKSMVEEPVAEWFSASGLVVALPAASPIGVGPGARSPETQSPETQSRAGQEAPSPAVLRWLQRIPHP